MQTSSVCKGLLASILLGAFTLASRPVLAWNDMGHEIVALIADHYMSPAARERVQMLLAGDDDPLTTHDIAGAAKWADKFRANDASDRTRDWHFADIDAGRPNIPRACFGQLPLPAGTPASRGPARECVIDKINQFADELADPQVSTGEQRVALKFLLNLVADLHQPLNVAIEEGNDHGMKVRVAARTVTPGDLYGYWDDAFVHQLGTSPTEVARRLIQNITPAQQAQWSTSAPQLWALEAHQLAVIRAYGILSEGDDHGVPLLTESYVQNAVQTIESQLSKAGVRLAYLLNESFSPAPRARRAAHRAGDARAGHALALNRCSNCHVVASKQTQHASEVALAPDFQAIAYTRGMSEEALGDFLHGQHPTMPTLTLTPKESRDVIAYILSLRDSRRAGR